MIVEVDVASRTVQFHDPARFRPPAGATRVPLERVGLGRGVRVSVEGRPEVVARLDLGCGAPLVLGNGYWVRERLLEGRRSSTGMAAGVEGMIEHSIATIRTLRFGGVEFRDVPTSFKPVGEEGRVLGTGRGARPSRPRAVPPLDRLPARHPLRRPRPLRSGAPFERGRLGLAFDADAGHLRVLHVSPG